VRIYRQVEKKRGKRAMTSDDYIFLYSKLSIDKIPLHIKDKIDSGDEFTEVEKQEILKIIRKEKMDSLS
jgi:hypothetical protein